MTKTILFIDTTYPKAYDNNTLRDEPLGGTESSVIRTANILSSHYKVFVLQKSRKVKSKINEKLSFWPLNALKTLNPDAIVVLRKFPYAVKIREKFPQVKLYLWLHTYKNKEYLFKHRSLRKNKITLIANSKTHKFHLKRLFEIRLFGINLLKGLKSINIEYCYNPIPAPKKLKTIRDKNKLIYLSSPNKGLDQVIEHFVKVKQKLPQLKLYVANPGYKKDSQAIVHDDIIFLGSLAPNELMQHIAESLCVFYPQNSFAETFGLIYAEANAYGTPVVAHDIGAAREILHDNNTLIDTSSDEEIYNILQQWNSSLPKVSYNNNFSNANILKQWTSVLTQISR